MTIHSTGRWISAEEAARNRARKAAGKDIHESERIEYKRPRTRNIASAKIVFGRETYTLWVETPQIPSMGEVDLIVQQMIIQGKEIGEIGSQLLEQHIFTPFGWTGLLSAKRQREIQKRKGQLGYESVEIYSISELLSHYFYWFGVEQRDFWRTWVPDLDTSLEGWREVLTYSVWEEHVVPGIRTFIPAEGYGKSGEGYTAIR